jgi:carbamoyl-phosphate synthase large subunit
VPKRNDINTILLIGSGPIIIGQACEFDYSGTQACRALREEGYKVILVNSNPATIMTDPEMADVTYLEPLTAEMLEIIIERERPDVVLPTMGGQTALNLAVELSEKGVLARYGVELIGAKLEAIRKAEDRELFKEAMARIGQEIPRSRQVSSMEAGLEAVDHIGFPIIIRPSFTLGGTGGSIAYNIEECRVNLKRALELSPVSLVLVEESVIGWKEYELEVMRDCRDNVVIICSIENMDSMGIHTGDSITVAPAQTLTDREYQRMRDAAIDIIREIGVDTGGSNIQFAINPDNGQMVIIEMNPRVSRSSALASKATGFPIAKIAAKLAVGLTLDEIPNDITRETPASFEPTIDYVVTKFPRFAFEKFPGADATLTTQMKSVGEAMSIGRTFKESLNKAIRSLETDSYGLLGFEADSVDIRQSLKIPGWDRLWHIAKAFRIGIGISEVHELTKIDPWFLVNIKQIVDMEERLKNDSYKLTDGTVEIPPELLRESKEYGLSDRMIASLSGIDERSIRELRKRNGIEPVFKLVDTCAAEFVAFTPYLYSTYEKPFYSIVEAANKEYSLPSSECESNVTDRKKIVILGSGPNRIGQGIEFDYCCVHAVYALRELGYEAIMINCNPETVSTDYDTADKLYFEPLALEDVLNIIEKERPEGVLVQFGGQTPLKLAVPLEKEGVRILGTSPDAIDMAEDRKRFTGLLNRLGLKQPENGTAMSTDDALKIAGTIGYPVMVRPSYVLGGRAMEIVYDEERLHDYMKRAVKASPEHPVLIDRYLEDAIEVDVDAISDETDVIVGAVMEHIEEAGIHSGDSACVIPPHSLSPEVIDLIKVHTGSLARELRVKGLMNIQFAVNGSDIFVLEVNPRACRTIPFVSKATGLPLAKIAAKVMAGKTLKELGVTSAAHITHTAVKEAVFPFDRFPGVDTLLGPEMKSTGEAMGIDDDFGMAYFKAETSSRNTIPLKGKVFISIKDKDKPSLPPLADRLLSAGFSIVATKGTALFLMDHGVTVESVNKVIEGRPNVVDLIKNNEIDFVINTVSGAKAQADSFSIRESALRHGIPYSTTMSGFSAAVEAVEMMLKKRPSVRSLQEYHKR